jgi:hypothetical protein
MKCEPKPIDASRARIAPEKLAAKLDAIHDYQCPKLLEQITKRPRLVELLWFIQAMSMRAGGLAKFCEELLAEFPERLGTPAMRATKGGYTLKQKFAIWAEIPHSARPYVPQELPDTIWGTARYSQDEIDAMEVRDRVALTGELKKMGDDSFVSICRKAAYGEFPGLLAALCTDFDQGFEEVEKKDSGEEVFVPGKQPLASFWFFEDLIGAIFEFMDRRAARIQKRLAMTEVARRIFDALDFAQAEKVMVRIEGDSRFGKTEALQAWSDTRPGAARLVRVPSDNSIKSFLIRVGEALGINCSYGVAPISLKYRIEYILKNSNLFLILDEAHYLIPQNYSSGSAPTRLNWVRGEIVDRNLPVALAVTPQSFKPALSRFVKKTGYTMEQFLGRNFLTCVLPEALTEDDMIAVARIHSPELDGDALGYIANEARLSQNYLQAVEAISRRARFLAGRSKRRIGLKELETAVSEVLPRTQPASGQLPSAEAISTSRATESPRKAAQRPVNGRLSTPLRDVEPARSRGALDPILSVRSLRGAGPEREEAELVSADS